MGKFIDRGGLLTAPEGYMHTRHDILNALYYIPSIQCTICCMLHTVYDTHHTVYTSTAI